MRLGRGLMFAVLLVCAASAWAADPVAPEFFGALPLRETPALAPHAYLPAFFAIKPVAPASFLVAPTAKPKRTLDSKFLLLMAAGTALTVADYELTQHCLARGACVEADPLLPTSRAGMYATNIPLNAVLYFWSYRRKQEGKRLWWVAPLAIAASHAVGVGSNLRIH